jgi:diguanylate cyclase (GGDEF)-like protein
MMTRLTIVETGPERTGGRVMGLTWRDWGGVAVVAGVSVLLSVLVTMALAGAMAETLGPAVVIPLVVSIPASAYLFRQRRAMADLNRQMLDLLRHDPLTGLLSRRFFLAAAEGEAARGGVLLLIDADRFKGINDRYGHPAGDAVLVTLAERFRAATAADVLIGRLGGEEFAAFAPGRDVAAGCAMGEAIGREVRAARVPSGAEEIACTVSMGLAVIRPGGSMAEAIRAADEALYRAKALGRDRLCVAEEAREVAGEGVRRQWRDQREAGGA